MTSFNTDESFSSKIQEAILSVCLENYSSHGIEVDGLVCVSFRNPTSNCVVKIHKYVNSFKEKSDELRHSRTNNYHWNDENPHRPSDIHEPTDNSQEQMYFYEDSLENESEIRHQFLPHERNMNKAHFINEQNFVRNSTEDSRSGFDTDYENIDRRHIDTSHGSNLDNSFHSKCSDVVKIEQDEVVSDTACEFSNTPQTIEAVKRNNLETIIERFSNQNNLVRLELNHTESQDSSKDFVVNASSENFHRKETENVLDGGESSESVSNKYGDPVCIDLSETDPDLIQVQSEIEARLHEEIGLGQQSSNCTQHIENFSHSNVKYKLAGWHQKSSNYLKRKNLSKSDLNVTSKNIKKFTQINRAFKNPSLARKPLPDGATQMTNSSSSLEPKKVYCKFCGVGFTNSGNKNRHERSTCGAVKYKCEFCESLFSRSDSRARHMLYSHGLAIKDRPTNLTPKKTVTLPASNSLNSSVSFLPNFQSFSDTQNKSVGKVESDGTGTTTHENVDSSLNKNSVS